MARYMRMVHQEGSNHIMSTSPKIERLMILMAQKSASDLYLSANAPIMIRLNGMMVPVNENQQLSADDIEQMLASVFTKEQMQELSQEGELNVGIHRESVGNFRFSCFRQRNTSAAVIRYIPSEVPPFDTLHLPPFLADLALLKRGLVLFVGSTGCGKSTSIASLLDLRNTHLASHILTIEDPIEFFFTNKRSVINQREIGTDTASLRIGLKNALRQMPDCIFIGEIRDPETMSAALSYAQAGQLCVSTLHANNAYEALTRIASFYPEDVRPVLFNDLATALKAIVSQRLVHKADDSSLLPAVEVMHNTRLISELIEKGEFFSVREAMEKSLAEGCQTFEDDLARMVKEQLITQTEAINFSDSPSNLLWRLQNDPKKAFQRKAHSATNGSADEDGPIFNDIELNIHQNP